jgi:hypothetical protein
MHLWLVERFQVIFDGGMELTGHETVGQWARLIDIMYQRLRSRQFLGICRRVVSILTLYSKIINIGRWPSVFSYPCVNTKILPRMVQRQLQLSFIAHRAPAYWIMLSPSSYRRWAILVEQPPFSTRRYCTSRTQINLGSLRVGLPAVPAITESPQAFADGLGNGTCALAG